jgi:hypothetical protein
VSAIIILSKLQQADQAKLQKCQLVNSFVESGRAVQALTVSEGRGPFYNRKVVSNE